MGDYDGPPQQPRPRHYSDPRRQNFTNPSPIRKLQDLQVHRSLLDEVKRSRRCRRPRLDREERTVSRTTFHAGQKMLRCVPIVPKSYTNDTFNDIPRARTTPHKRNPGLFSRLLAPPPQTFCESPCQAGSLTKPRRKTPPTSSSPSSTSTSEPTKTL